VACYILLIEIEEELLLTIGKLGTFQFKPGFYLYVGSARKNLQARINRHLRHDKKLHWHIDYLLTEGEVTEVILIEENEECRIANALRGISEVSFPVPGFGSSDCRCPVTSSIFRNKICGKQSPSIFGTGLYNKRLLERKDFRRQGRP